MIKSSTPVWVLLFSFLFGFEKMEFRLLMIISIIVLGISLTIDGESRFDWKGFTLVSISAIASGLRWNIAQYLMKPSNTGTENNSPLSAMYHLSPVMFVTMVSLSIYYENPFQQIGLLDFSKKLFIMAFGGVIGIIFSRKVIIIHRLTLYISICYDTI